MKTITIIGWRTGFQKVGLTNLLRHELGYTLSDAKAATDTLLANRRLDLQAQDSELDQIVSTLRDLGAELAMEQQK